MSEALVSDDQIEHFRVFGFVVLRDWVTPDEVATIRSEVAAAMEVAYAHAPFDGTRRHWLSMTGPTTPTLSTLLEDPRFWDASEQLLGAEVAPLLVDANRYTGDTPWHPDSQVGTQGTRFLLYLDPLTASTGALRVIPGSHRAPLHDDLRSLGEAGRLADGPSVPAHAAEVEPGDAIVFNWPMFHAAFGGGEDRRMCTASFFSCDQDHERVRSQMRNNAALHQRAWGFREGFPYWHPQWLAGEADRPRRRVLIQRMRSLGLFEAAAEGEALARSEAATQAG